MDVSGQIGDISAAGDLLRSAIARQEAPGAVALVRWHGKTVWHEAVGWAALKPERRAMQADTIFDLASLTKPLVTTPLVLQLVDRGAIALYDPVSRHLPAMTVFANDQVTIRHLLTHTSGLPAWSPLYVRSRRREDVLETIAEMKPAYDTGSRVIYSCLGYILLGVLIETLTGRPLDELASQWLFDPLDLIDTGYGPQVDPERCAGTECGNLYEQTSVAAAGLSFQGWREECIRGAVHDGNAWYAMGGISGNAGLFGTARDVGLLGQLWLDCGCVNRIRVLSEGLVREATVDCTPGLDEVRGLGWQINRPPQGGVDAAVSAPRSAGSQLGTHAFGHTGFTGTSIWIDPDLDLVAVLLTNRVHPTVGDSTTITMLRGRFHDAVVTAIRKAVHSGVTA